MLFDFLNWFLLFLFVGLFYSLEECSCCMPTSTEDDDGGFSIGKQVDGGPQQQPGFQLNLPQFGLNF
jgi:hypothetical protein